MIYANYMFIVCLFFDFCFRSFFLTCLFFSPTRLKDTNPDSTEDSIPDSNLYFSWCFSNVQQISQVLPSKSAFCSKVSFFSICWFVFFLFMFLWVFCWVSVFQLFLCCFFFFWIVFYVQSFCGIVVFKVYFLFFIWFLDFGVLWGFFSQHCVVFIGI